MNMDKELFQESYFYINDSELFEGVWFLNLDSIIYFLLKAKNRISEHIYALNSYFNQRTLKYRNSSTKLLKHFLSSHFRKIFLNCGYLMLYKYLIVEYGSDVIIEICIERFIENYVFQFGY